MTEKEKINTVSGFRLQDDELEKALLAGEHADLLEQYLGEAEYDELRKLTREAQVSSVRGGPRVYILPGIMGSKLGKQGLIFDDVLWLDPLEVALGKLTKLALKTKASPYKAVGVILLAYLKLKLRLKIKGYDADFYPYDWRLDIKGLGEKFAETLKKDKRDGISLVAHSMGGLVARAAVAHLGPTSNIKRIVMLGTPNYGSFAPVLALRGTYPIVKKIAVLDRTHSAKDLAAQVFSSFPGLYQLLPAPEKFSEVDLYDSNIWPSEGPKPRAAILKIARDTQDFLAPADNRFCLIAGVNQETITGLRREDNQFAYESSLDGDGTVPLALAELPGAPTYYIEESHGSLPNNRRVAAAVADILKQGHTRELPAEWQPVRSGTLKVLRDADLDRMEFFEGRRGGELRPSEIRHLLEEVAAPGSREQIQPFQPPITVSDAAGGGFSHEFSHLVVSRRRQHRVDIRLAFGSISEVDARAYVLGLFRGVEPSGPAQALDNVLEGLITEFTTRRMLTGNVGDVFLIPTGRYPVRADMILFAGLGPFDRFSDEAQQLCAENCIRTFIRSRIDEFATVLLGAGSVRNTAQSLENILIGFFRGLLDADTDRRFRRITFCEFDRSRFQKIKEHLFRLSSTSLFDDVEVTIDEEILPAPAVPSAPSRYAVSGPDPVYLIVRREQPSKQFVAFRSSVLTSEAKATVVTGAIEIAQQDLKSYLKKFDDYSLNLPKLNTLGSQLAKMILHPQVLAVLPKMKERQMVVVHDAPSSQIPWETIRIDDWSPAADTGLCRRYMADDLSVAKWLEERKFGKTLDVLLVVNPTEDLAGAEAEGNRIKELLSARPWVKIRELRGPAATRGTLLEAFKSGDYDVVHYAGHAEFNEGHPELSGIRCYGSQVLSGADLAGLGNLPALVFFNACESGRVRGGAKAKRVDIIKRIQQSVGLAEAFMRGGVANYVGTYWPVGDASATSFAATFYPAILNGQSISRSLLDARRVVREAGSIDWADYIHYGSPHFIVKHPD